MRQNDTSKATELRESMMAVTRQLRRHRPDNGLTLSQMQLLGEISRAGVTTPAGMSAAQQPVGAAADLAEVVHRQPFQHPL